ncbi:hypothetical protein F5Y16DRAFT_297053 [Xylariaceae sp. FL0255]|nr:hypothetical protein F5Y16DRAFT_297053 [Xylariaceae sp. FL0255]
MSRGGTYPGGNSSSGTSVTRLKTLAGLPTATMSGGIDLVTTLPAPIVHPRPMITPGRTMTFAPSQQSSPMTTGFPVSGPLVPLRHLGSVGWVPDRNEQLGPIRVRAPTVMVQVSIQVEPEFTRTYLTL